MNKITLCIVITTISIYSNLFNKGALLLKKGQLGEVHRIIALTNKKSASSPRLVFLSAKLTRNGEKAYRLFLSVATNNLASDSVRSESYYHMGLFYLVKKKYIEAEQFFSKAVTLGTDCRKQHLKGLANYLSGDAKTAEMIWNSLLSNRDCQNTHPKTLYYIGNLYYSQKKYSHAINCYNKVLHSEKNNWVIPSIAGRCLSSFNHKNSSPGTILYKKILSDHPNLLEKEMLNRGYKNRLKPNNSKKSSLDEDFGSIEHVSRIDNNLTVSNKNSEPKPVSNEINKQYTLQIGAFGSKDNANKLVTKMRKYFDHVSIKTYLVKEMPIHRVRVGLFESEAMAIKFGSEYLKTNEIKYRVVKK